MKKKVLLLSAVITALCVTGCGKEAIPQAPEVKQSAPVQKQEENPNYNLLTSSEIELTDEEKIDLMTSYHFAKTEGYISNELLKEYVGGDEVASFANVATTYLSSIYNINGRDVKENKDLYREKLNSFVSSECIAGTEGDSFVDTWLNALSESEAVLTSTFTTGEDFVYADESELYVRGILKIKVESAKDMTKLNPLLPVDLKVGETKNIVYDIGFKSGGVTETILEEEGVETEEEEVKEESTSESSSLIAEAINETDKEADETPEETIEDEETPASSDSNAGKIDYIFALGVV